MKISKLKTYFKDQEQKTRDHLETKYLGGKGYDVLYFVSELGPREQWEFVTNYF